MKILIVFNREPYDKTDVTWNGLRLARKLLENGHEIRIFLMNDAVDLARNIGKTPEGYEQDLSKMLREMTGQGVEVKVSGTCLVRCGIHKTHPYFEGAEKSTIQALSDWVIDSDKVITF